MNQLVWCFLTSILYTIYTEIKLEVNLQKILRI